MEGIKHEMTFTQKEIEEPAGLERIKSIVNILGFQDELFFNITQSNKNIEESLNRLEYVKIIAIEENKYLIERTEKSVLPLLEKLSISDFFTKKFNHQKNEYDWQSLYNYCKEKKIQTIKDFLEKCSDDILEQELQINAFSLAPILIKMIIHISNSILVPMTSNGQVKGSRVTTDQIEYIFKGSGFRQSNLSIGHKSSNNKMTGTVG